MEDRIFWPNKFLHSDGYVVFSPLGLIETVFVETNFVKAFCKIVVKKSACGIIRGLKTR